MGAMPKISLALLLLLVLATAQAKKRSMIWIYGSSLFPEDNATLEETFTQLKLHNESFNAISPQMYSIGCPNPTTPPTPPGPAPYQHYIMTANITFCSGGGDLPVGPYDVGPFGAGFGVGAGQGWPVVPTAHAPEEPLLPEEWSDATCVEECQAVCSSHSACVGFTLYQNATYLPQSKLRACAFRTGTVANKPSCDGPDCTARCYEKAIKPPNFCTPVLISSSSDPGITPDPALAKRFHALGPHVEYWPTLSSPGWLSANGCSPPSCYNGTGNPAGRCPCGQEANQTAMMFAMLANPEPLIASAIAEAKKWNITGYNLDFESKAPLGDNTMPVIAFANKFSAALAKEGVQTSYCIGGMNGDADMAKALNQTAMRTVPMNLYNSYDSSWQAEVDYWQAQGMGGKLGIGFCPTCYDSTNGESPAQIAQKFMATLESGAEEIDMFAFGGLVSLQQTAFAPYWEGMKLFLAEK